MAATCPWQSWYTTNSLGTALHSQFPAMSQHVPNPQPQRQGTSIGFPSLHQATRMPDGKTGCLQDPKCHVDKPLCNLLTSKQKPAFEHGSLHQGAQGCANAHAFAWPPRAFTQPRAALIALRCAGPALLPRRAHAPAPAFRALRCQQTKPKCHHGMTQQVQLTAARASSRAMPTSLHHHHSPGGENVSYPGPRSGLTGRPGEGPMIK